MIKITAIYISFNSIYS